MGWLDAFASTMSGRPSLGEGSGSGLPMPQQDSEINNRLSLLDALVNKQSASGGPDESISSRMSPVGLDAIIQDWVRQQFIYRRSILQDLYIMAFQVTEIRSALLSIKREVFRKGLGEWTQKFVRECPEC